MRGTRRGTADCGWTSARARGTPDAGPVRRGWTGCWCSIRRAFGGKVPPSTAPVSTGWSPQQAGSRAGDVGAAGVVRGPVPRLARPGQAHGPSSVGEGLVADALLL